MYKYQSSSVPCDVSILKRRIYISATLFEMQFTRGGRCTYTNITCQPIDITAISTQSLSDTAGKLVKGYPIKADAFTLPPTSNFSDGLVVPIPILPLSKALPLTKALPSHLE